MKVKEKVHLGEQLNIQGGAEIRDGMHLRRAVGVRDGREFGTLTDVAVNKTNVISVSQIFSIFKF